MRLTMGSYSYARITGDRQLNLWLENGWEYVCEEKPGVHLIKRWIVDEPKPGGNGSKKKRKRR